MMNKKGLLFISLAMHLYCIAAEPPSRYSLARFRNARLQNGNDNGNGNQNGNGNSYGPPSNSYGPSAPSNGGSTQSGPYPPSGWKPEGPLLLVPGESHSSGSGSDLSPPPRPEYGPAPSPGPSGSYIPSGNGNGNGHGNGNGFGNGNGNGHNGNGNGHNGNGQNGNGNGHNGNGNGNGNGHNGNGNGNGHNGNGNGNGNGHNGNGNGNGNGHNGNGNGNGNGHNGNGNGNGNGHGNGNGNGNDNGTPALDNTYLAGGGPLLIARGSNGVVTPTLFAANPTFLSGGSNDIGAGEFGAGTTYLGEPNYLGSASSSLINAVPFPQTRRFYFLLPGARSQNLVASNVANRKERELLQDQLNYQFIQPLRSPLLQYQGLPYGLL